MGEITIKNDSFIQSMHNDIQCIESINPNDKGTSRQYWFTANMLANIFDISVNTVKNHVDFLVKWNEVQVVKNLTTWKMTYENSNLTQNVTLYDLQVFNKLAMQLRTDAAMEIRSKFSDILVEIETTGQYNVQKQDPSYVIEDPIERAKAWIKEQEEKRALEAEKEQLKLANETLENENNELITHNKELSITNDELITENELLRNDHFNTKQVYEQYQSKFPNAPRQALSTMLNKIRKLLCNITNERQSGRRIYKKHVTNKKGDIEWRQEYFFDKDTLQIFLDHVRDNPNYVINIRLK